MVLSNSQIKIWGKWAKGFLCYDWTKKWSFPIKVNPLNLDFSDQAKNIPVILPSFPIKTWGKSVQGFMSYDRIHKQTDITTYI